MTGVTGQITWVYCRDLAPAARFYRDLLGLELKRDAGSAMIFATVQGAQIGVCEVFEGRVVQPAGGMITLLVDGVAAVDSWYARLNEAGATLRGQPEAIERFQIYSFFCEDPNGYLIEVQTFTD